MTVERPEGMESRRRRNYKNGTKYGSLASQVMYKPDLLPTPRACTAMYANLENAGDPKRYPNLETVIARALLPTPRANKVNDLKMSEKLANRGKSNLEEEVAKMVMEGLLPTPTGTDFKGPYTEEAMAHNVGRKDLLRSLHTHLGVYKKGSVGGIFQLSPLFTEEMMGFPLGWILFPFLSTSGEKEPSQPAETP